MKLTGLPVPDRFKLGVPPVYFDINTTATYAPPITVCIDYSEISFGNEDQLCLLHWTGAGWEDVTISLDTVNDIICGEVYSLSEFIIVEENLPPVADANGPYTGNEGAPVVFDASASFDPEVEPLQYRWDFDNDGFWDTEWSNDPTVTNTWLDDYSSIVVLEVSDGVLADQDETSVVVNNLSPSITSLTTQTDPVSIDTPVQLIASFTDPGILDTHTYDIDWGDTTPTSSIAGGYTINDSHLYAEAGVYTITLTVTDDDGDSNAIVLENYVVVYNSDGGFVTGGGWIYSLAGAYMDDPTLEGKASFGFVSKYKKGQTTPTGNTEFQFKAGDRNFHSDTYDWLVIAGKEAMYRGTGTINGEGAYGFMLSAIDAALTPSTDVDLFRIKIWDKDTGEVIYDNLLGGEDDADPTTAIGGGNIVIHEK